MIFAIQTGRVRIVTVRLLKRFIVIIKLIKSLLPEILGVIFATFILALAYLLLFFVFEVSKSDAFTNGINKMLSGDINPISIGAIIAISIFIIREFLEAYRKSNARTRKVKALKTIISEEIEINYWAWLQIKALVTKVKEQPKTTQYQITTSTSGVERFEYFPLDGGGGGRSFPPVVETMFIKLIIDIAELDKAFYGKAILYSKSIAELKHLRNGAYDFIHETQQGDHYTEGFVDYALDEIPPIYVAMSDFYEICTGNALNKHRMR